MGIELWFEMVCVIGEGIMGDDAMCELGMGECAIGLCMRLADMKSSRCPKCPDDDPTPGLATLPSWKLPNDMAGGLAAMGLVTR
jgi:hypothetical protein